MTSSQRHTERQRSKKEALALTDKELEKLAQPGAFGTTTVEYNMQDGLIVSVHVTKKQTHLVGRRKAAA